MIYPTENTYPDLLDLKSAIRKAKLAAEPGAIYQDFRAAFEWLRIVIHFCWSHNTHSFVNADHVRQLAEGFVGRQLNEDGFKAAVFIQGLKTRVRAGSTLIKVPDFERINEALPRWKAHVDQAKETACTTI